jgi:hypothetical protein
MLKEISVFFLVLYHFRLYEAVVCCGCPKESFAAWGKNNDGILVFMVFTVCRFVESVLS